ncbi:MAG: HYR domain-containing protein [Saprospiraceae bacterium]|nr:HYR domain-containing protein [Candidatus Opimibacter iunctus]
MNPYMTSPLECSRSLSFEADASDNCGVDGIVYTIGANAISFPYNFPVGLTIVGVMVTDIHGNTSTCTFDVVIADTEQPSLTCPVLVNPYTADAGECDASLSFSATATDNCGVAEMVYSINSNPVDFPYDFPVGSTTVHVLVTDVNGNTNTCAFEVVVVDDQSPEVTCPVPSGAYMTDAGQCTATLSFEATSSDNCGLAGTVYSVNSSPVSFPYDFPVGSTIVGVTVTDIYGNVSTCSFTVQVEDVEIPVITCMADQTQVTDMGQCNADVDIPAPTAGDNCGVGSLINSYNGTGNASDNYPTGTTTVIWTVTDIHGNTNSCVQLITVMDDQALQ